MDKSFLSIHTGKCITCKEQKPLDSLVEKTSKGYACVDCVVEQEAEKIKTYAEVRGTHRQEVTNELNPTIFKKLMIWCFG